MADSQRVRILRHVLGEKDAPEGGKETLAKGSVVDVTPGFAAELVASKGAEAVDATEKLVKAELHPAEKAAK